MWNPDTDEFSFATYLNGEFAQCIGRMPDGSEEIFNRPLLCCIDSEPRSAKPQGPEIAAVSKRLGAGGGKTDAPKLARAISAGKAFLPSMHDGKRSPDTWQAQQLFCIDVDNDPDMKARGYSYLPFTDAVVRAWSFDLPLLLTYESFSSTEECERYRLLFALEEPTMDKAEAQSFADGLLAAFPEADQTSNQLNRLFFGTNKEVQLWNIPLQ